MTAPVDQAVEAAAKLIYETWKDIPEYRLWQNGGNSLKQDEARRIARQVIELASQQEVAAFGDEMVEAAASALVDSCIAKGHWRHATEESKAVYREHASAVLASAASQRVPGASPASRDEIVFDNPSYPGWLEGQSAGAGGAGVMDARPDSFHSDSGECGRVQGTTITDEQFETLWTLFGRHMAYFNVNKDTSFVRAEIEKVIAAILAKGGDQGEGNHGQ